MMNKLFFVALLGFCFFPACNPHKPEPQSTQPPTALLPGEALPSRADSPGQIPQVHVDAAPTPERAALTATPPTSEPVPKDELAPIKSPDSTHVQEFHTLIEQWDKARNARDAVALSKLFAPHCFTHGKAMTPDGVAQYIGDAFRKHTDYAQEITSAPVFDELEPDLWSIRLNKRFTQSAKTVQTQVMLVVERIEGRWLIVNETDDSMDRNIMRRLGLNVQNSEAEICEAVLEQLLIQSPYLRHLLMQQWQQAQKLDVHFQIRIQKTEHVYTLSLIEEHKAEQREMTQAQFIYDPRIKTLSLYNTLDDALRSIQYNSPLFVKASNLCR